MSPRVLIAWLADWAEDYTGSFAARAVFCVTVAFLKALPDAHSRDLLVMSVT